MKKELKIVADTNIIISAAIGKSPTFRGIYNAFVDCLFTPVLSPSLQQEILNVVKRPRLRKYFRAEEIKRFTTLIAVDSILAIPTRKLNICRDIKDNIILETAIEAKADFILTSDKDLLILKSYSSIPIINPRQFIEIIRKIR